MPGPASRHQALGLAWVTLNPSLSIIPILELRKLRHNPGKWLIQGTTEKVDAYLLVSFRSLLAYSKWWLLEESLELTGIWKSFVNCKAQCTTMCLPHQGFITFWVFYPSFLAHKRNLQDNLSGRSSASPFAHTHCFRRWGNSCQEQETSGAGTCLLVPTVGSDSVL